MPAGVAVLLRMQCIFTLFVTDITAAVMMEGLRGDASASVVRAGSSERELV